MAVRQLAGPFTVRLEDGTPASPTSGRPAVWHQDVGLIMDLNFNYSIVTLDGVAEPISFWLRPDNVGWWSSARRMLALFENFTGTEWTEVLVERRTIGPYQLVKTGTGSPGFSRYVKLPDGRRIFNFILEDFKYFSDDGTVTADGIGSIKPFVLGDIWAGRHDWEIFVAEIASGSPMSFAFYDTQAKKFSQTYRIGLPANALTYVPEWGVVVSLHNGYTEMRVWSLETQPATLSDPQLIAGENKGGFIATYQVQVLGDAGEPCKDELIDWSTVGAGSLIRRQSKTDENGYATVKIKFGLEDHGQCVLTAALRC